MLRPRRRALRDAAPDQTGGAMPAILRSVGAVSTASWVTYFTVKCIKRLAPSKQTASPAVGPALAHNTGARAVATRAMSLKAGTLDLSNLGPPPPPQKVQIALCQLHVTADKLENIETAKKAIAEAASKGAQLVVLPEIWNSPYSNDSFPQYAEVIESEEEGAAPSFTALAQAAKQHGVVLVGGSIPERDPSDPNKLYNTCCVFSSEGKLLGKHRKLHLFDIDIPGKIRFKESDTLSPGMGPTLVDTPLCRLGVGICYDIRFPELATTYCLGGAQLIVYPGAFNTVTGPLHWELLQKARAVDNQLFVVTCSPARNPDSSYQAWGHSTAVGPFGEILATCDHEPAIVYAELDFAQVLERRANMPLTQQRRRDIFSQIPMTPNTCTP